MSWPLSGTIAFKKHASLQQNENESGTVSGMNGSACRLVRKLAFCYYRSIETMSESLRFATTITGTGLD
jgi:hypothetical protein